MASLRNKILTRWTALTVTDSLIDLTHWYGSCPWCSLHLCALTAPVFPPSVWGGCGHRSGRLGAREVWHLVLWAQETSEWHCLQPAAGVHEWNKQKGTRNHTKNTWNESHDRSVWPLLLIIIISEILSLLHNFVVYTVWITYGRSNCHFLLLLLLQLLFFHLPFFLNLMLENFIQTT